METTLHSVLFVARHKDNPNYLPFKEAKQIFLTNEPPESDQLFQQFKAFTAHLPVNMTTRFYYSINARDQHLTKVALQHYLLDHDVDLSQLAILTTRLANRPENAVTHRWLLDVDIPERATVDAIVKELQTTDPSLAPNVFATPNHYGIIVDHGFDTRELIAKFLKVDVKRDDMQFVTTLCNDDTLANLTLPLAQARFVRNR